MTTAYKVKELLSITQVIDAGIRDFAALGIYSYLAELRREALTLENLDKFSNWEDISVIGDAVQMLVEAELIEEIEEVAS